MEPELVLGYLTRSREDCLELAFVPHLSLVMFLLTGRSRPWETVISSSLGFVFSIFMFMIHAIYGKIRLLAVI